VIQRIPDVLTSGIARFLWVRLSEAESQATTPEEIDRLLACCETFDRHRMAGFKVVRYCDFDGERWPCQAITSMAANYADHADYAEAVRRA
jgi:hypothetical protein